MVLPIRGGFAALRAGVQGIGPHAEQQAATKAEGVNGQH
jgi:hypothetical protein